MTETTESSKLDEIIAWFEIHKQKILIGFAAVLVLWAAVYLAGSLRERKVRVASAALLAVEPPFAEATNLVATAESYVDVARSFSGTAAAAQARLLAGATLFENGDFDGAREQFQRYLDSGSAAFRRTAEYGVAMSTVASGAEADGIRLLESLERDHPSSPEAEQARLTIAKLREDEDPAAAYEMYGDFLSARTNSLFRAEASTRRQQLSKLHPELVAPPVPPAAPSGDASAGPPISLRAPETEGVSAAPSVEVVPSGDAASGPAGAEPVGGETTSTIRVVPEGDGGEEN